MFYEEQHIQEAVVNYVRFNYPNIIFTCAPANAKSMLQGIRNKKMGYCKGWPDLFFAQPAKGYHGLFVELKTEDGKIDKKNQQSIIDSLNAVGYKAVVCYGFNQAVDTINEYLKIPDGY